MIDKKDLRQEPIERASTIPSEWYTNPDFQQIEQQAIFSREWQLACHQSQIPEPGDSWCVTIAGNPVLVIRTPENEIRAFYNVCRHRGGPMAVKKGTTTVLQCQYHGWTYLTDGSLRGVPQFDRVELFDKKDFGLIPVAVAQWQGLIFVCLADEPRPFELITDGITERFSPTDLSHMKFDERVVYLIECNWKVYVDNYLEGYHIPIVHPELAKLLDYRNYVTETAEWYSLQYSPFAKKDGDNPYHAKDGEAYYYFIYPNFMLNILPGRLQTNIVEPVSAGRCRVIFDYFYADPEQARASGTIADDMAYSDKVQQEDIDICELVQRGLGSKAYDKGRFSVERELGVYHFQSLIKRSLSG
jgi:choline monooxygenase